MANVPQKTLNWLWGVLQREYHDSQRAYSDLAQTLSLYQAFAPRTDVYTFDNGTSALLLHLTGTIPVNFRGSQYRFPIAIWLPHAYPRESPIFYVTPTDGMTIRPGQHVSHSNGRVYHPYLARWSEAWERSNIVDFLKILADIFAREPPVMATQQISSSVPLQAPPSTLSQQPPPRPPPPLDQRPPPARPQSTSVPPGPGPPPPPPKPTDQTNSPRPPSVPAQDLPRPGRYDAPPPLPGQGPPLRPPSVSSPPPQNYQPHPQYQPQRQSSLRQSYAPQPVQPHPVQYSPQRQSIAGPTMPVQSQQQFPPAQPAQALGPDPQQPPPPANYQQQHARHSQTPNLPQQNQYYQPQQPRTSYQPQPQPQPSKPKMVQPNIMDESPFDISLPSSSANLPTPAIPPNPEKQHILQTLETTLLSTLQNQISQSSSAFGPLQSQHAALQAAQQTLQQELNQLQTLNSQLQQNISSLTSTIASADRAILNARNESSPSKIPSIDDLIIPPTVVARQLYDSVAEQRGYEASIYALTDGLVRGRIGGELWARKTRECAREEFKRKWLVKRVGRGMGLDTGQMES